MPDKKTVLDILGDITEVFVQAGVAAPVITPVIMVIAGAIKGLLGRGPSLTEIADRVEAKTMRNDVAIRAEIARMEALINPVP